MTRRWWWNFYWNRSELFVGYFYDHRARAHVLHVLPCLGFAWGRT